MPRMGPVASTKAGSVNRPVIRLQDSDTIAASGWAYKGVSFGKW